MRITDADPTDAAGAGARLDWISPTMIAENPFNARKRVDATDLVDSVRSLGVIQPIVIRPLPAVGTYQVVAGSRRLAAAKLAGLGAIPAIVMPLTDEQALEHTLTENVKRQDMNPIDEAAGYQRLVETSTAARVAATIGQTESHVYRRLRLLDLESPLQTAVAEGRLSLGHAERLVRLPKHLRKLATDLDSGIVWRRSLLDPPEDGEKWIPTRDDLAPVHALDEFIRRRMAIDPRSTDVRHFQPDLAADVDEVLPTPEGTAGDPGPAGLPTLVCVTEDPVARLHMGVGKTEPIPLTPAHWREILKAKDRCEFAQPAVVTHGGPYRLLEVCTTRTCVTHFPPPKKAKASRGTAARARTPDQDYKAQLAQRDADRAAWEALMRAAAPEIAAHVRAHVKMSAALVRLLLNDWDAGKIEKWFGVKLTDTTALQVLALSAIDTYDRSRFLKTVKPFKFNLGAIESQVKAQAARDQKNAVDTAKAVRKVKAAK